MQAMMSRRGRRFAGVVCVLALSGFGVGMNGSTIAANPNVLYNGYAPLCSCCHKDLHACPRPLPIREEGDSRPLRVNAAQGRTTVDIYVNGHFENTKQTDADGYVKFRTREIKNNASNRLRFIRANGSERVWNVRESQGGFR